MNKMFKTIKTIIIITCAIMLLLYITIIATARAARADYIPPCVEYYYPTTTEEKDLILAVVEAEAGGEGYTGQALVAQCILNACIRDNIRPDEAIKKYSYASGRPESQSTFEAVSAVFDNGYQVTNEEILFFYAPARCRSKWHESQIFVIEYGGHRFFAPRDAT